MGSKIYGICSYCQERVELTALCGKAWQGASWHREYTQDAGEEELYWTVPHEYEGELCPGSQNNPDQILPAEKNIK